MTPPIYPHRKRRLIGLSACGMRPKRPTRHSYCTGSHSIPRPTPTAAGTLQPVDVLRKLTVNGLERSYLIHIRPACAPGLPSRLVFVFHSYSESAITSSRPADSMTSPIRAALSSCTLTAAAPRMRFHGTPTAAAVQRLPTTSTKPPLCVRSWQIWARSPQSTRSAPMRLVFPTVRCWHTAWLVKCGHLAAVAPVAGALVTDPCQPASPFR